MWWFSWLTTSSSRRSCWHSAFDYLDWAEVGRALRSLDDAIIAPLGDIGWCWIAAQGLQTSWLGHNLPCVAASSPISAGRRSSTKPSDFVATGIIVVQCFGDATLPPSPPDSSIGASARLAAWRVLRLQHLGRRGEEGDVCWTR